MHKITKPGKTLKCWESQKALENVHNFAFNKMFEVMEKYVLINK